jgi:predicted RNA binding protein YcfA (HicA-like mRNA interferase family)
VSERLLVLSGERLVKALERAGWQTVRQRGSHVRMKHPTAESR